MPYMYIVQHTLYKYVKIYSVNILLIQSALVAAIFVAIGWILVIAGFGSEIQNQL